MFVIFCLVFLFVVSKSKVVSHSECVTLWVRRWPIEVPGQAELKASPRLPSMMEIGAFISIIFSSHHCQCPISIVQKTLFRHALKTKKCFEIEIESSLFSKKRVNWLLFKHKNTNIQPLKYMYTYIFRGHCCIKNPAKLAHIG